MSFYKKYELQRLAHEGEAKVFRATQTATGTQVLLHVFPVNDATRDLASEVGRRLAAGPAHDLIESGEFAGAIYVVTAPVEGIQELRAYLHTHPGAATPAASPATPGAQAPPPPAPAVQPAPPPPRTAPPPTPFQAAPPVHTPPSPPVMQPLPPPFQAAPMAAPPPAPPPPTAGPPPPVAGFPTAGQPPRSAVQHHPTTHPPAEAVTQPVEPRRRRRTTEIISHGTVTVGSGPAEPATSGPGEFTRMFSDQLPAPQGGVPAAPQAGAAPFSAPPASPLPAHAPASQGPGEFTRLFSAPPPAPASSSAPFAPPAGHQPLPPQGTSGYAPPIPQAASPRDQEMADFERIFGPAGGRPFPSEEPPSKPPAPESPLPPWPQASPAAPIPSQQAFPPAAPQQTFPPPQPFPPQPQHGFPSAASQPAFPPPAQSYPPPHAYQPPKPAPPSQPSEFTQFFGSGFSAEPVDVEREQQNAAAHPEAPPKRPFQQASEFTRMFGPGQMGGGAAPPPPPPPRSSANWADLSGAYTMFDSKGKPPQGPGMRGVTDPGESSGPSEYTRMISGGGSSIPGAGLNQDSPALRSGAMPAVNPQQIPGQQPGAPPSKAGQIGIYIAIGGIVLALIVALVLLVTSK